MSEMQILNTFCKLYALQSSGKKDGRTSTEYGALNLILGQINF